MWCGGCCYKQMKLITASVCLVKTGRSTGIGCHVKHSSHSKVANPGSLHLKPLCDYSQQSPHREQSGGPSYLSNERLIKREGDSRKEGVRRGRGGGGRFLSVD